MYITRKIKYIFSSIFKGSFSRNILIVSGGTALAQIISAVLSPVISRLYTPADFGVLSLYSAVLGMLAVAASLKYEWSIPIAKSNKKASNIIFLSVCILIVVSSLLAILFTVLHEKILGKLIGAELIPYRFFLPLGVLLTGLYSISLQIGYRDRSFKIITETKLTQALTGNGTKIGLGLLYSSPLGLILGSILSSSAGFLKLGFNIKKNKKYRIQDISWGEIKECATRYKDFPIYSAPGQILNSAGLNLPKIFLGTLYGIEVTGAFGFTSTIISIPVQLVGNSVSDVFYSEAAKIGLSNPSKVKTLSWQLFRKLLLIGFFPFITLVLFGPFLFSFVFGTGWEIAGKYSQILAVLVYARLVFMPFSRIFFVYEKQRLALFLDILRVLLVVIAFVLCKLLKCDEYVAISFYTFFMCTVYVITFVMIQITLRQFSRSVT